MVQLITALVLMILLVMMPEIRGGVVSALEGVVNMLSPDTDRFPAASALFTR